jgi:hypothetical protein
MAKNVEHEQSRAPRDEEPDGDRDSDGDGEEAAVDEQELASYLEERIKPGLNRGSIPMLARSIAREIAQDNYRSDEDEDEDEDAGEGEDEDDGEGATDLESDLHTLQERLGDDWTLFYAVHGGDAWLTAETQDATQRVEAPSADVLVKAVELLTQGGGRSAARRPRSKDDESD